MTYAIEAQGLEKTYPPSTKALDGLSLAVSEGTVFGLLVLFLALIFAAIVAFGVMYENLAVIVIAIGVFVLSIIALS